MFISTLYDCNIYGCLKKKKKMFTYAYKSKKLYKTTTQMQYHLKLYQNKVLDIIQGHVGSSLRTQL